MLIGDGGQSRVLTCSHLLEVCILEGSHGAEQAQDGVDRLALKVRKVPDGLRTKTHFSLWKLQSHTCDSKYSIPQFNGVQSQHTMLVKLWLNTVHFAFCYCLPSQELFQCHLYTTVCLLTSPASRRTLMVCTYVVMYGKVVPN